MRRREFLVALGGAAAGPLAASAQNNERGPVIGYLDSRSEQSAAPFIAGLRRGLAESGNNIDKRAIFEFRWGNFDSTKMEQLAAELIALQPAVIFACGGAGTALIAKKLTRCLRFSTYANSRWKAA